MSYLKLHDTDYVIVLKSGTRANLLKTATSNAGVQGEPHYTTDTKQLFIHDGTRNQPLPTLEMAVLFEDQIISKDNEIIYNY